MLGLSFRETIGAANAVVRATADRWDDLLARDDLDDEALAEALVADAMELEAAVDTLVGELERE